MAESEAVALAVERHDAVLAALDTGEVDEALRLSVEALAAAAGAFGPGSPDLANVILTCAIAHEAAGEFVPAQTLAEQAAAAAGDLAGTDDEDLMALWVDIEVMVARLSATLGAFAEAETRLAAALGVAERVLAPGHPSVLAIHNMRGVTGKYAGRFEEAQAHYERIRAVIDVEPIADKDALAGLLHNLAGLDHSRGRVAQGLAHAQRGLRLRIEAVGPDHPDVARDLNAIGALYHDGGDSAAADDAYRRALRIFETTLGTDHYEVAMTCANLAVAAAAAGDGAGARGLYERALTILESCVGPGHPDVGLVQHNLAVLLADLGERGAALELLNRAGAVLGDLAADHPRRRDLQATIDSLSALCRSGEGGPGER